MTHRTVAEEAAVKRLKARLLHRLIHDPEEDKTDSLRQLIAEFVQQL